MQATYQAIRQAFSLFTDKHVLPDEDEASATALPEVHALLETLTANNREKASSLQALNEAAEGLLGGDAAALLTEREKIQNYMVSIEDICKRVTQLEEIVAELDTWSRAVQAHVGTV
jgi:hypothetical protein